MKSLEIKIAIAEQIEEIVALDELCFAGIWSKAGYLRELESPNSSLFLLWLTEERKKPKTISASPRRCAVGIGCLWSIVNEAHITLLGIHPEYRGRGLGMLLFYSLLQDGVGRDLERATLEVNANNYSAINLYQKFGFKVAGKRRNYYPKTGEDALILWLNGLNKPEFQQQLDLWWLQISDRLSPDYVINVGNN